MSDPTTQPGLSQNDEPLRCPECTLTDPDGVHMVHPVRVRLWPLSNEGVGLDVAREGLQLFAAPATAVRGVVITIRYDCEQGHVFEEERRFHKGVTLASVRALTARHDCIGWAYDPIWRD